MMVDSHVAVTPGTGVLVRRASAVLFDATGENVGLVAAFDAADSDDEAIASLKRGIVATGFSAQPLVAMRWQSQLEILVFGDIEVHSSAPSAPMITGAGSTSWVEHHLDAQAFGELGDVSVACGLPADPVTDLRLGITGCGGTNVTLTPTNTNRPSAPEQRALTAAVAAEHAHVVEPIASELPTAPVAATPITATPVTAQQPAVAPAAVTPITAEQQPVHALEPELDLGDELTDDVTSDVASDVDQDIVAEPEPVAIDHPKAPLDPSAPIGEPDLMLPTAATDPFAAEILAIAHEANGPTDAQDGGDQGGEERPNDERVGEIVFPEGTVVRADREIVLGRTPDVSETEALPVTIQHSGISRSHAQITVDGSAVLLTDLDSRNGTWVCPPGNPTPMQLHPGVPHLLEDGEVVQLGSPDASFSYRLTTTS